MPAITLPAMTPDESGIGTPEKKIEEIKHV